MGRTPKPWYWEARQGWYATVGGKRQLLARGKRAKAEAERELRRLQAAADAGQPKVAARPGGLLLGELLVTYLADLRRRVEHEGLSGYRPSDVLRRLAGLEQELGDRPAQEVWPRDVQAWLAMKSWGPTSRADAVAEVRALYRWGLREGLLTSNPLEALRSPPRRERREQILDPDQIGDVLAQVQSFEFRELLLWLWLTGARPKEARTLEARHVEWDRALVVRTDHKSYSRTRKPRVIPLSWAAFLITRRAAWLHPSGPIFRNSRGLPWTKDAVHNQVWRLRQRTGRGAELVAYALRHGFATRLLEQTGDLALGAAVLGHSSTAMLSRVYGHLEGRHEHLRRAIDKME